MTTSPPFPPDAPESLAKTIPSYLYQQYNDDDDLQGFVMSFNAMAQQYVTWFNEIGLPIYTGDPISGTLLDWVAQGLYGLTRPALSSGQNRDLGPYNTYAYNVLPYNSKKLVGAQDIVATTDDVFKRCITWNFFKGDGRQFNVRWLKRRIMRFLNGVNGTNPNVPVTYQISITFGLHGQVNIRLLNGERTLLGGATFNSAPYNTTAYNQLRSSFQTFAPLANASILREAILSGALQLPFQFTYPISIV